METRDFSEKEALALIARVFESNRRRMNFMRGELFVFWGALLTLTALAEYGLFRWTGDRNMLWSWLLPLTCGYIWTVHNARRQALVRTGFDDLLIAIWGLPATVTACTYTYVLVMPENSVNPMAVAQLLLSICVAVTAEFFRGKGSQQSGAYAGLYLLGMFGLISTFTVTFRLPFDAASGHWMLHLAAMGVGLLILPGLILRHITRKQCSAN